MRSEYQIWAPFSRGVDHIKPKWRMMDQFFHNVISPGLALDSLTTSHPISVDVKDPKEIEAIFDTISYKKVCCSSNNTEFVPT